MEKGHRIWNQKTWIQVLALPVTSCRLNLLNSSELSFLYLLPGFILYSSHGVLATTGAQRVIMMAESPKSISLVLYIPPHTHTPGYSWVLPSLNEMFICMLEKWNHLESSSKCLRI